MERFYREGGAAGRNIRDKTGIAGLPVCLFKDYETYAGCFESALVKTRLDNDKADIEKIKRPKRIKSLTCRDCAYYVSCEGIWGEYIKRRGWREFRPVP